MLFISFSCIGVKLWVDTVRDILMKWGVDVTANDCPSGWRGVTCSENLDQILKIEFKYMDLVGEHAPLTICIPMNVY